MVVECFAELLRAPPQPTVSEDVVEHESIGRGHEREFDETLAVRFALLQPLGGGEPVARIPSHVSTLPTSGSGLLPQLSQMVQPLSLSRDLALEKSHRFVGPLIKRHRFGDAGKDRRSSLEPLHAAVQNLGALLRIEYGEQPDTQAEGIAGGGIFFREASEPGE